MSCLTKSFSFSVMVILTCLLAISPFLQTVKGSVQTFQLVSEAYQGISQFELQVGDCLVGSFAIDNLGPYRSLLGGGTVYYWINVYLKNPDGETVLNYTNYPEGGATFDGSFNYTAVNWGVYNLWVYCGGNFAFEKPKTPEMTLNFDIVKAVLPEPANPEIMAWWKLDEGNGTIAYDSSWHNRQGTIYGANWTNVDGKHFLNFNGKSDYVSLPSLNLTSLDALTVSAWINSDLTKSGFIIYNGNLGEFKLGNGDLGVDGQTSERFSNYANFSVKLTDAKWYIVSSSFPMKPNSWHHIVGVWTKGESLKVYVDDVLADENDDIPLLDLFAADTTLPGSFPSSIGIYAQANWDKSDFFKGQMSNVMVFSKALNSQQIENLTTQIVDSLSIPKPSSNQTQPFPSVFIVVILAIVFTVITSVVLLIYRRHRKITSQNKPNV